jgi:hypothetical protein
MSEPYEYSGEYMQFTIDVWGLQTDYTAPYIFNTDDGNVHGIGLNTTSTVRELKYALVEQTNGHGYETLVIKNPMVTEGPPLILNDDDRTVISYLSDFAAEVGYWNDGLHKLDCSIGEGNADSALEPAPGGGGGYPYSYPPPYVPYDYVGYTQGSQEYTVDVWSKKANIMDPPIFNTETVSGVEIVRGIPLNAASTVSDLKLALVEQACGIPIEDFVIENPMVTVPGPRLLDDDARLILSYMDDYAMELESWSAGNHKFDCSIRAGSPYWEGCMPPAPAEYAEYAGDYIEFKVDVDAIMANYMDPYIFQTEDGNVHGLELNTTTTVRDFKWKLVELANGHPFESLILENPMAESPVPMDNDDRTVVSYMSDFAAEVGYWNDGLHKLNCKIGDGSAPSAPVGTGDTGEGFTIDVWAVTSAPDVIIFDPVTCPEPIARGCPCTAATTVGELKGYLSGLLAAETPVEMTALYNPMVTGDEGERLLDDDARTVVSYMDDFATEREYWSGGLHKMNIYKL